MKTYNSGESFRHCLVKAPALFLCNSLVCVCVLSCFKSHLSLCDHTDCSPLGSFVHGILQARILEWVAITSSRGSSRPRDGAASLVSPALAGRFFTTSTIWNSFSQYYMSTWSPSWFPSWWQNGHICSCPHIHLDFSSLNHRTKELDLTQIEPA